MSDERPEAIFGERRSVAYVAQCLNAIGNGLLEIADKIPALGRDQRWATFTAVAKELRGTGDDCHVVAQALEALAEEIRLSPEEREMITATKSNRGDAITADDFPAQNLPAWKRFLKRLLKL